MLIKTSPFLGSDRVRSTPWLGPATGFLKTKARIARKHGRWIAVANTADKVRLDSRAREKGLIHASVVEARHGAAVQSQRPRSDDEVSALQRSVPHCRHLGHAWCRKVLLHELGIVRQKLWKLAGAAQPNKSRGAAVRRCWPPFHEVIDLAHRVVLNRTICPTVGGASGPKNLIKRLVV